LQTSPDIVEPRLPGPSLPFAAHVSTEVPSVQRSHRYGIVLGTGSYLSRPVRSCPSAEWPGESPLLTFPLPRSGTAQAWIFLFAHRFIFSIYQRISFISLELFAPTWYKISTTSAARFFVNCRSRRPPGPLSASLFSRFPPFSPAPHRSCPIEISQLLFIPTAGVESRRDLFILRSHCCL